jgi:hypothetical protein
VLEGAGFEEVALTAVDSTVRLAAPREADRVAALVRCVSRVVDTLDAARRITRVIQRRVGLVAMVDVHHRLWSGGPCVEAAMAHPAKAFAGVFGGAQRDI